MRSANTTLPLHKFSLLFFLFSLVFFSPAKAQDNSPYSRYGLGNLFPQMNVTSRGMGGVSAAYSDILSVNYNNPASYAGFQATVEQRSKKVSSARVVLDAGLNITSRKLAEPNTPQSFTASDALFSHIYVGVPIRKNWGMSFGIRPLSRISYNIFRQERLRNSLGGNIDSVVTQYTGTGGSFLPTIGTGFGSDRFRVGANVGYLFGKKEITTRRAFINDSIEYAASNHTTNSNFGSLFFTVGAQSNFYLAKDSSSVLRLGASGNWKQTLNGTQDILRQTYLRNSAGAELQVDSVFQQSDIAGNVIYPASHTVGFIYDHSPGKKTRGFSVGIDYSTTQWNAFRFFGTQDLVQNNWEVRAGVQLTPSYSASRYGQFVNYRFGFFTGQDYINIGNKLPVYGITMGLGLPIRNFSRLSNQYSVLNLGLEYSKRGNDQNKIKEDLFRISLGLNFTDLWFGKRKYD